jgi:rhamnosyl/mannosyltransferase
MHVLYIYKDYYPVLGGIENHLRVLAEGMAARGHRITVLVTSTTRHTQVNQIDNLTIIKAARHLHAASTPVSLHMLLYARQMREIDIVHVQMPYPPGDLAALAVPQHPPLIVSYQSDIVRQRRLLRLYGPLLHLTLSRAACILASSPAYIHSSPWLRRHAARCEVFPLSVDPARFASADPIAVAALRQRYGTPLVLFVGRLRYYKGLHVLLQAVSRLHSNAQVLLVGSGPEEARLREQARDLQIRERVHFLGDVSDTELPAIYHAANVLVLPSHLRAEAFGIVQLEAQAAGLPVVCTELGTGTSYITRHGSTGFVVPPDDPAALARALDVLLENPLLARQMGAAGRTRAESEFSHSLLLDRLEDLYSRYQ